MFAVAPLFLFSKSANCAVELGLLAVASLQITARTAAARPFLLRGADTFANEITRNGRRETVLKNTRSSLIRLELHLTKRTAFSGKL